jgi:hypothetical protein
MDASAAKLTPNVQVQRTTGTLHLVLYHLKWEDKKGQLCWIS